MLVKTGFNGSVGGDSIAYVIFGVLPPPPFYGYNVPDYAYILNWKRVIERYYNAIMGNGITLDISTSESLNHISVVQ